ncbi:MAG: extracellular solute-binding protein [Rhodobacteraceae bacterium]|jgi:putrescine transport system substrate-binding protein|uniref:extracellular solute-binding protein n=1 Tax=Albidovulum sp. TaxID=1872424 RepID=UPI001E0D109C|nr:extracellular solute-binding protein [uncultured Defluviimonas sp.]MCB2125567.1 extracellular solute-binding protein [Paracoccaceae bacterium]MCC0069088.1 extracellular solute-binding protein [Paracoccaceae bacterium]
MDRTARAAASASNRVTSGSATTRFVATLSFAAFFAVTGADAGELAIYNWADYFGPETIARYEAETGTTVTLGYFDSNEMLETKLLTGGSGYDVVFPATSNAERELQVGALLPIEPDRLANYRNLDPSVLAALDTVPGGRQLGVPYTWGTVGIAYNPALVAERLGEQPMDRLDAIFKPENAAKLADCGIAMLDSPVEVLSIALNYLGAEPYSDDPAELERAGALLSAIAPSVRYFNNQKATGDLAAGNICVALVYSGDAGIAQARAAEAGNGVEVAYAIPREGTLMWIDLMAIPADSARVDAAYAFIDYMLRPEVIADVTNTVFFANANAAASALVDPAILGDPGFYPPVEVRERLFPDRNLDAKALRGRTRLWTKVKTGT